MKLVKILGIKKYYPEMDLSQKDQSYSVFMFEGLIATSLERNDSLTNTRRALHQKDQEKANQAYENWLWVLSMPAPLRYLIAYDNDALRAVTSAFMGSLFTYLRRKEKKGG